MKKTPHITRFPRFYTLIKYCSFIAFLLLRFSSTAQNIIAPYDLEEEYLVMLQDSGRSPVNTAIRPYTRPFSIPDSASKYSFLKRITHDQPLFSGTSKFGSYRFDPVISFMKGSSSTNGSSKSTYLSSRGFQLDALLGKQWRINMLFVENQAAYPAFIDSFAKNNHMVVPALGLARKYQTDGYDYSYTDASVTYTPSSEFSSTLGYGQLFIGEGYRSMFLSDNAYNYPYLKLDLHLPKLQYTMLFSQYINMFNSYAGSYQRKWSAANYLNLNLTKKLKAGIFQGVIWNDQDENGKRGFDVLYLIPFTILHPIAFSQNSADNTFVGLHAGYQLRPNILSYFQLFLDDLNIQETLKNKKQHLNNKYALQAGIKAFHKFHQGLMRTRLEYNYARPYTYGHRSIDLSYSHYQQPLAHPLGANFHEAILTSDIQYKRWYSQFVGQVAYVGRDRDTGYAVGNNVFGGEKDVPLLGTYTLQGKKEKLLNLQFRVGYILNKSWRTSVEAACFYRKSAFDGMPNNNTSWFQLGIITKLRNQYFDY